MNRRLKIVWLAFFLLVGARCSAQNQAAIWYFGDHAGVDFRGQTPQILTNSAMWTFDGSAAISDADGNLLFYTNGVTVWNRANQPMPNGHNLWGYLSTTQTLIIPIPGSDSLFYVFTASPQFDFGFGAGADSVGFHYSLVDMGKASGYGDVVKKNVLLFRNTTEKMTACFHANGKDVWLVAHEWGNNSFRSYLITENGIDTANVVVSQSGAVHTGSSFYTGDNANARGQMKLSPDGKKIAFALYSNGGVQVLDFNSQTGTVSNPSPLFKEKISDCSIYAYWGVEFSPNSKFLYFDMMIDTACAASAAIFRYDVTKSGPPTAIAEGDFLCTQMQLAPDGKVYVVTTGDYLGRIENSNEDKGVEFVARALPILPGQNVTGLPNFIQSYFLFPDPVVEMPNVFTPNGDALNPKFVPIRFNNVESAALTIVNRWGKQLFYSTDPYSGWDGGVSPSGVYFWFLSYSGKNGKAETQRGWVQLLR